ncbi:MAG: monooxygenase [Rhizobiaceae bacterium]|nr:monooxygenase [Rhizobiaceae bacterium]
MKTAIVTIKGPKPFTDAEIRQIWDSTCANYVGVPGLVRKYYVVSEDRMTIGGVYLWETKAEGEAIYTDAWRQYVVDRYEGEPPSVAWFDTSIVVDNRSGQDAIERHEAA